MTKAKTFEQDSLPTIQTAFIGRAPIKLWALQWLSLQEGWVTDRLQRTTSTETETSWFILKSTGSACRQSPSGWTGAGADCASWRPSRQTSSEWAAPRRGAPCTLRTGRWTQLCTGLAPRSFESMGISWRWEQEEEKIRGILAGKNESLAFLEPYAM